MENEQGKLKMAEEEGNGGSGGEDYLTLSSPTGGERVKLFCSHGGKILPRPADGALKYVGGETRVVAIPRSITFSELMKKIKSVFDGEYVLKYQIALEDLDCLVSVRSDEDIRHLLDEYDRLDREGSSKLRVYLFPVKPTITESQTALSVLGPHATEQRFVDAINGIVPTPKLALNTSRGIKSFSPSPTDGSPPQSLSPRSNMNQDNCLASSLQSRIARFHRVASSPANLDNQHSLVVVHPNGYIPSQIYHHGYNIPQDHHVKTHLGYQSPTLPQPSPTIQAQEHHFHPHAPTIVVGHHNPSYFNPVVRVYPGSGSHNIGWGHLEQYATTFDGSSHMIKADVLPPSPG